MTQAENLIPKHGGYRNLPEWERDDPRREESIARRCTTADAEVSPRPTQFPPRMAAINSSADTVLRM